MVNFRFAWAALFITVSIWLIHSLGFTSENGVSPIDSAQIIADEASELFEHGKLQHHGLRDLSSVVELSTLFFHAVPRISQAPLVQELDVHLPDFELWTEEDPEYVQSYTSTSVDITKETSGTDISSIIFGVATTLKKLDESLEAYAHWASNSDTTIVAIVPFEEKEVSEGAHAEPLLYSHSKFHNGYKPKRLSVSALVEKARFLSLNLIVHQSPEDYTHRVVSLLEILHTEAKSLSVFKNIRIEWASIIDDDTFFPSTPRLLDLLSRYNSSLPQYVGGLTEDLNAIDKWGYFAFGGAGIFLSLPLLTQLAPYFETCLTLSRIPSGDGTIAECIYKYTTTKLSVEKGLNQLDLFGDHSGFYEAVRPLPASVHRWKSWGHHDMVLTSAIAEITGQESILQKYHLADGWWMTHGFSIVKYSNDQDDEEFAALYNDTNRSNGVAKFKHIPPPSTLSHRAGGMEKTFNLEDEGEIDWSENKRFFHSLAPMRPKDGGKQQYLIESAVRENERTMTLYYVRRVAGVARGVIRVIWTKGKT